jgi:hypothetical protein
MRITGWLLIVFNPVDDVGNNSKVCPDFEILGAIAQLSLY